MSEFGERLRQARTNKGMSQEELAKRMNLTQAAISQFEKGARLPTPANIRKFAEVFEVEEGFLAGESEGKFERTVLMRTIKGMSPEQLRAVSDFAEFQKSKARKGDGGNK